MAPPRFPWTRALVLASVGAVAVLAAVAWLISTNPDAPRSSDGGTIGVGTPVAMDRAAPAFDQPVLLGRGSLDLGRYQGEVVVLNFWRTTCRACRTEVPELERLWQAYRSRGVGFVGVDYLDDEEAAIGFVRSYGMTYPSVVDPNGKMGDAYGVFGLPTTFIITPDQRIRFAVYGRIEPTTFRRALESALAAAGS
jgi:peroxiredoxin